MFEAYQSARAALASTCQLLWTEADIKTRRYLALTIVLVLASSLLIAIAPAVLKTVVDGFITDDDATPSVTPFLLISLYVTSLWVGRCLGELRWLTFGLAQQRLNRRISRRLFEHVIQLPMRFHLDHKTGELNQTLTNGLVGCHWILQHSVFSILPVVIELATMGAVLIYFDQPIFLAIFGASLIAYTVVFAVGAARISEPARAVSSAHIEANVTMTDSIVNYETVKYCNAEEHVQQRYDGVLKKTEQHWTRFYQRRTTNGVVISIVFGVALSATLTLAARAIPAGTMTIGEFVLINTYMLQIIGLLETIGIAVRDATQGVAFVEKMISLFRHQRENLTSPSQALPSDSPGALVFDSVTFSYEKTRPILRNVSFSVEPGNTVAIVGQSGSGKSSLIRLLVRLYEPDSGEILLNGTPISRISLSTLRQSIAVVPQDTVLFHETIGYNIGFGQRRSPEDIERAGNLAHLHELVGRSPEGYGTIVGARGLKLSGGEKQRVAIARAALKNPQLFVFDEATSSLDFRTELGILRNLKDISHGSTTLIIAHRLSTVVHANEIIVLSSGKVVERGSHSTLMGQDGLYAAMWRAQRREGLLHGQHGTMTAA